MTVRMFVNYLEDQPIDPLPPEARPLRMPNHEPELREWQAIEHIYREGLFTETDYTTLLSPRFPRKAAMSFEDVISFVEDNPGYDVYLFDSGPHHRYFSYNIYEFLENALPGYAAKFTEAFTQIGEAVDFAGLGRGLPENTVNGNAWIANARFWREVIGQAVRLIETLRARPEVWRSLCEPAIYNGRIYPYLPYVLERFVPYWLETRGGFSVKAYPYGKDYVLSRCVRPLELPLVSGLYDTINEWDAAGPWSPDKREFMRDISRAFVRQLQGSGGHMIYPWTGERIDPVR